ncbi:hypothetical protein Neosp_013180 [[Neocosmospora] mangrovei]
MPNDRITNHVIQSEVFTPPNKDIAKEYNITFDPSVHGTSGYVHSSYSPFFWPTTKSLVQAVKELGISIAFDQANGSPLGGYFNPHSQDPVSVTRSSAREAYYDSASGRKNFYLAAGQQVTRVLTEKHHGTIKAIGVERSNLTDATFAAKVREQYEYYRKGPLTSPLGDFLVFIPLSNFSDASSGIFQEATNQEGTEYLPAYTQTQVTEGYKRQHKILNGRLRGFKSAILEVIWDDGEMLLCLQHPYSRGSIKAMSPISFDAPVADPGLLKNPLDIAILAEGIRFSRRLVNAPAMQKLEPLEVVPGADVTSNEALEEFIRSTVSNFYHPAGSCKMGSREEGGVVDAELKVYGVEGLRVVDASVMPLLPAAHTMATVYAVAEKAADIIKRS